MPSEDLLKDLVREITNQPITIALDSNGIHKMAEAVLDYLDGKPGGLNILAGRGK